MIKKVKNILKTHVLEIKDFLEDELNLEREPIILFIIDLSVESVSYLFYFVVSYT